MTIEGLASPRITLLREALENGQQHALEDFWREVEERGTRICVGVAVWLKDYWHCWEKLRHSLKFA